MQLIADRSEEHGIREGLGLIPGEVKKLEIGAGERIPHVGWNEIEILQKALLFEKLSPQSSVYFVHSYHYVTEPRFVTSRCSYAGGITSSIRRENIMATQFHPEKSQHNGLKILRGFLNFSAQSASTEGKTHA